MQVCNASLQASLSMMSSDDTLDVPKSTEVPKSTIFDSQDILELLEKHQKDISRLDLTLKSGDKISLSFNGISLSGHESFFHSLSHLKPVTSIDSAQSTVSLDFFRNASTSQDGFTSMQSVEWARDYAKDHLDVTYENSFSLPASQKPPKIKSLQALPPKKRAGKTDWNALFTSGLSPLVEAASRAEPQPVREDGKDSKKSPQNDKQIIQKSIKPSKRKPRKIIPEIKDYVDQYTDQDILFGRGGRSNHHPGNKLYRDIVTQRQPYYKRCDKNEKTKVAQNIVDDIIERHDGRFLELDKATQRWYVVPNIVARRKVGQALRENNTEEARAAKRQKYGSGKKSNIAAV